MFFVCGSRAERECTHTVKSLKVVGVGVVNFLARFFVGGMLLLGLKMNPESFVFGFILTVTAFAVAFLLLRFVMKPNTRAAAVKIALVWMVLALLLDVVTAVPIVQVSVSYLLSEVQTWTRLFAILLAAFLLPLPRKA